MSDWKIRFGTAGTSDSFAAKGYKKQPGHAGLHGEDGTERLRVPVRARRASGAGQGGKNGRDGRPERDILFSVHAPYYISMSSLEEDKRLNSVNYLLQSAAVCKALGGRRVIFHPGSCGKQSREAALEKALDTMRRARRHWTRRLMRR